MTCRVSQLRPFFRGWGADFDVIIDLIGNVVFLFCFLKLDRRSEEYPLPSLNQRAARIQPAILLHPSVSISPSTQCGFKRSGALKSAAGSSFSHDVSRRERARGREVGSVEELSSYNTTETSTA